MRVIKDEDVKVELGAESDCEEKEESRDELDCDPGDYDDDYEHFSGEDEVKPAKPALDLLVKSEKRQRKTPKVRIYANVSAKTIQKSPNDSLLVCSTATRRARTGCRVWTARYTGLSSRSGNRVSNSR